MPTLTISTQRGGPPTTHIAMKGRLHRMSHTPIQRRNSQPSADILGNAVDRLRPSTVIRYPHQILMTRMLPITVKYA